MRGNGIAEIPPEPTVYPKGNLLISSVRRTKRSYVGNATGRNVIGLVRSRVAGSCIQYLCGNMFAITPNHSAFGSDSAASEAKYARRGCPPRAYAGPSRGRSSSSSAACKPPRRPDLVRRRRAIKYAPNTTESVAAAKAAM